MLINSIYYAIILSMEDKPRVLILLSTYNGEKYLRELLDSLFNQRDVDVTVFASDDISTDSTPQILEEYKQKFNLDYRINKENKNFTYNFLDLIYDNKDSDFDYFALSDQDDVWLDDKIISAINLLKQENKHFYCSNLTVVDEKLENPRPMNKFKVKNNKHAPYILENICTGCTAVFDKEFMKHLGKHYPNNIYLHDYWLMLVAAFTSSFVYDTNSHILYRQHGDNQIGSQTESLSTYYKKFNTSKSHRHNLVLELLEGFGDEISEEDKKDLNTFLLYKNKFSCRMKIFFSAKFNAKTHPFLRKIKLLLGKY